MGWFAKSSGSSKARDAALRLGFSASQVARDFPVFDRQNRFQSLTPGQCVRYSLPRASSRSTWELLQRGEQGGAQLPNGYLLKSENPDPGFAGKFRSIAEEFPEEYFEFEGTATDVAAFWEEWGGAAQVERLHSALSSVRDI